MEEKKIHPRNILSRQESTKKRTRFVPSFFIYLSFRHGWQLRNGARFIKILVARLVIFHTVKGLQIQQGRFLFLDVLRLFRSFIALRSSTSWQDAATIRIEFVCMRLECLSRIMTEFSLIRSLIYRSANVATVNKTIYDRGKEHDFPHDDQREEER